jgi:hypothetical protein
VHAFHRLVEVPVSCAPSLQHDCVRAQSCKHLKLCGVGAAGLPHPHDGRQRRHARTQGALPGRRKDKETHGSQKPCCFQPPSVHYCNAVHCRHFVEAVSFGVVGCVRAWLRLVEAGLQHPN